MARLRSFSLVIAASLTAPVWAISAVRAGTFATAVPSPRGGAGMVYDAGRGVTLLFGGRDSWNTFDDTWTWDGHGWTRLHPSTSPTARSDFGLAYDQARGQVVLFGGWGAGFQAFQDTWTWNGTAWTQQHPAIAPPARYELGMVGDQARGDVVLFGGLGSAYLNDTWTWDGVSWTKANPSGDQPTRRCAMGMAYDEARAQVVLFGGETAEQAQLGDTWTWDGTAWREMNPAESPSARSFSSMAFAPSTSEVLLWGRLIGGLRDNWSWDGTTWVELNPAAGPSDRGDAPMAADPTGDLVLFGGGPGSHGFNGDTWIWDGSIWRVPLRPRLSPNPDSGPPGTAVVMTASGFGAYENIRLNFTDSVHGRTTLGIFLSDERGGLSASVHIPLDATVGPQVIDARGQFSRQRANTLFTVTP